MLDRCAEHDCAFVSHILQPCVHDQLIPLRDIYFAFQIADIILHTVETNLSQINIRVNTDAANWDQFANLHGGLNIQFVCCILKYIQNYLIIIRTLRRCR